METKINTNTNPPDSAPDIPDPAPDVKLKRTEQISAAGFETVAGGVTAPQGFLAAAASAEIRYQNRRDLALLYSAVPSAAVALYTQNKFQAAPIVVTREHLRDGRAQAVLINSGIANAGTGQPGLADARRSAELVGEALKLKTEDVAVASTGVIGMRLPMERVAAGIFQAAAGLSAEAGTEAAQAIMTTDTRPKEIAVKVDLGGHLITIGGMAKGSGMIHPNMATMLAFLTTDAEVDPAFLHQALTEANQRSFNMITVDGDTSTNDMVIILANGQAKNPRISGTGRDAMAFQQALNAVAQYLAKEIARDGEGATQLIEVRIQGAASLSDAQKAGRAIAGSSLVKSAVHGKDANWGRILAAAGYSGAEFDPEQTTIWLGEVLVAEQGTAVPFDEEQARQVLEAETVLITVDLGTGNVGAVAWGCDLTFDYIKINANYRS